MKLSTLTAILLFVGLIAFVFVQMSNEANSLYGTNINTSNYDTDYNFVGAVQNYTSPIQESIDTLRDEDSGWLNKIAAGFTGVIAAVTFIPGLMGNILYSTGTMITGFGEIFGLPQFITWTFLIMIAVWGIYQIISFFQGRDI